MVPPTRTLGDVMDQFLIGAGVGVAAMALAIFGSKAAAWVEAKIEQTKAITASHAAVAAVTSARAQVMTQAAVAAAKPATPAPPAVTGPTA